MIDGSARDRAADGHISMTAGAELAKELRAGRTLFTHVGHHTGLHAELEEWLPEGIGWPTTGWRSSCSSAAGRRAARGAEAPLTDDRSAARGTERRRCDRSARHRALDWCDGR